ncbi:hypothetical protein Ppb6_02775 [Photorhabdus australis subsp. thailandensis]|uniref:Uncharacterized protein n=1 Tax=Photorhabdus australis subsp. thailandensis TaxID=2805096 RepID=A0A1C0U253_9GAMM|nr:hypothetical protein [Photorhabdus australis]OCQ51981.1 hypothetical protein Ppb6_02775 [Photorhabdus australis subsp. thailandensis]
MAKLRHCQLSSQAELVLQQHVAHEQNLSALSQEMLWQDAVFYTIFMLPYTQALELALTFISRVYERDMRQEQRLLLQQVRHWRANGGDLLRHELFDQAQTIGFDNPISCLALSVFWSEGSMTTPDLEDVYPQPWQSLAALADTLCLILHFYGEQPEQQMLYVEQFFQLAHGQLRQLLPSQDQGRKNYLYHEAKLSGEK